MSDTGFTDEEVAHLRLLMASVPRGGAANFLERMTLTVERLADDLAALRAENKALRGALGEAEAEHETILHSLRDVEPECCACGGPVACVGVHDGALHFSCGECCGHGDEDGWCVVLPVDALRAENKALREALTDLKREAPLPGDLRLMAVATNGQVMSDPSSELGQKLRAAFDRYEVALLAARAVLDEYPQRGGGGDGE